ncbi:chaplin [Streptomyces populi]|uniref:chaplin n=1 Tax=Streptomyces populi TaxID=2058924 RepID=UPI0019D0D437|nr:chaplin [Streptomyces populi]
MTLLRSRVVRSAGLVAAAGAVVLAGAAAASADSGAQGAAIGSPGVLSGNVVQIPISIPVNACGNTVSVIGLLNPTFGNTCVNTG